MASTFKTEHLQLNRWQEEDKPRMEDFNADNQTLDQWAGEVRDAFAGKADNARVDELAGQLESIGETLDTKADTTAIIMTAGARRAEGVFTLSGLPEELPALFTVRFTADADFVGGDVVQIAGEDYTVLLPSMVQPLSGLFRAGAVVTLDIDRANRRAFASGGGRIDGGGGNAAMTKRFDVYTLPASATFGTVGAGWVRDDSLTFPVNVAAGYDDGAEVYLCGGSYVFVLNKETGLYQAIVHSFGSVSNNYANSGSTYKFNGNIVFEMQQNTTTNFAFQINTETKAITRHTTALVGPLAVFGSEEDGYLALGGNANVNNNNYLSSGASGTYHQMKFQQKQATGAWSNIPLSATSQTAMRTASKANATNTHWYHTGACGAVVKEVGHMAYVAVYGYINDNNYYAMSRVLAVNKETKEVVSIFGQPAFVSAFISASNQAATAYQKIWGLTFRGKTIAGIGNKMYVYDPETNKVDTSVALPDLPLNNAPYCAVPYGDSELRVYTANGAYRLIFEAPEVPDEENAEVLKIYEGQFFHGDRELEIQDNFTITKGWQRALRELSIRAGDYDSTGGYRVYVETRPDEA